MVPALRLLSVPGSRPAEGEINDPADYDIHDHRVDGASRATAWRKLRRQVAMA